jgi:hypothetical protein
MHVHVCVRDGFDLFPKLLDKVRLFMGVYPYPVLGKEPFGMTAMA